MADPIVFEVAQQNVQALIALPAGFSVIPAQRLWITCERCGADDLAWAWGVAAWARKHNREVHP